MKTMEMQKLLNAYIYAPQALVGVDLVVRKKLLLAISGGKITAMNQLNPGAIPAEVKYHPHFCRLEEGLTLLPSLIDAHVHLALDGEARTHASTPSAREADWKRIQQDLELMLRQGIGAVRDGGDRLAVNRDVGRLVEEQSLRGPRVVPTGEALRKAGSYGAFLGAGVNDLRRRLAKPPNPKAGQLKVIVSGIVSFREYGRVDPPSSFCAAELRQVVEYAHTHGMKVMAHASGGEAVELAIRAGADSIEHGYFISKKQLEEMASRGTAWIPTLIPVAVQAREPLSRQRSAAEIAVITRTYREHLEKVAYAAERGVPLGLGTDSGALGVRHGVNLVEEMFLYHTAGLSSRDVLRAATSVNAKILGLGQTFGTLEINKGPHLIAVRGNPLKDLNSLKQIAWHFLPC